MAQVSTSLDVKEVNRLDALAASLGLSRSATLRLIVTGALKNVQAFMEAITNEE